ncbi:MAG: AAA family ATPase [Deltaproteobacteria bacterium]|nr:AAA family ATPase [Deltaproteobacteria bacterium]
MNLGKIIAFSGSHGTGKTTAAHALAVKLKLENPGAKIGFLSEVARECPYPINRKGGAEGQLWIFGQQLSRELSLCAQNDIVVADRCLLDCVAYASVLRLGHVVGKLAWTYEIYVHEVKPYKEIRILPPKKTFLAADGVRDTSIVFQRNVHKALVDLHKRYSGPVDVVWPEEEASNGSV